MSDTPLSDALKDSYAIQAINWYPLCQELERENAALREDKARLDSGTILLTVGGERVHHVAVDLRAAIDAARKEAQP